MRRYLITYDKKVLGINLDLIEANNRLLYYVNNGLAFERLRIMPL